MFIDHSIGPEYLLAHIDCASHSMGVANYERLLTLQDIGQDNLNQWKVDMSTSLQDPVSYHMHEVYIPEREDKTSPSFRKLTLATNEKLRHWCPTPRPLRLGNRGDEDNETDPHYFRLSDEVVYRKDHQIAYDLAVASPQEKLSMARHAENLEKYMDSEKFWVCRICICANPAETNHCRKPYCNGLSPASICDSRHVAIFDSTRHALENDLPVQAYIARSLGLEVTGHEARAYGKAGKKIAENMLSKLPNIN